ncbi:MAG: peptidyl-prolyl cis-trans isomerase [bacterium]|nr:peptidyl-prolyl cis-trans isomerase [bacterium]
MRRCFSTLFFILPVVLLLLFSCRKAEVKSEIQTKIVIASVNGEEITKDEFDKQFKIPETPAIGDDIYTLKLELLNSMINEIIIMNYAKSHNITVSEEAVQQEYFLNFSNEYISDQEKKDELLKSIKKRLIVNAFLEKQFSTIPISDQEILDYYNQNSEEFYEPDEVYVQQIYVNNREIADKIYNELKAGTKFETLAEENNIEPYNEDPSQIYNYKKGELPPEFEKSVFELSSGKYTKIIASSYGFHIFKLKSKKLARVIKLTEAENVIRAKIYNRKIDEAFREWIKKERLKYEIKINQKFLED